LTPIVTNLGTALIIFVVSLFNNRVRDWLFPPEVIQEYPLFCTAEPYINISNHQLIVDFFIINKTKNGYSRQNLVQILHQLNPDPNLSLSPDIELKYLLPLGTMMQPYLEPDFNDGKGNIVPTLDENSKTIKIRVNDIKPRAIVKVSIPIAGLPEQESSNIRRTRKDKIPLAYDDYEEGCYKRS
jgi:hypothetical protein